MRQNSETRTGMAVDDLIELELEEEECLVLRDDGELVLAPRRDSAVPKVPAPRALVRSGSQITDEVAARVLPGAPDAYTPDDDVPTPAPRRRSPSVTGRRIEERDRRTEWKSLFSTGNDLAERLYARARRAMEEGEVVCVRDLRGGVSGAQG